MSIETPMTLPNLGPAIARRLIRLGIAESADLRGQEPDDMFFRLEQLPVGARIHACSTRSRRLWRSPMASRPVPGDTARVSGLSKVSTNAGRHREAWGAPTATTWSRMFSSA
jgi:hypothetical protein